ncbi:hypothetical protein [Massilia sp. CF038]|uniref:hypothetical protein n=1 Tax=Massilia sp. CF038 TaxID=1881045 RepID=UPI00091B6D6D|nr:hypothetical protein [Massilia sp. CF038]SHG66878.1 hypothetical protein SAMN05428948_1529 [Massilia sp. CF038]
MLDKIGFGCCTVGASLGVAGMLWQGLHLGKIALGLIFLGLLLQWIAHRSGEAKREAMGEAMADLSDGIDLD